jgi:hypothetical protein
MQDMFIETYGRKESWPRTEQISMSLNEVPWDGFKIDHDLFRQILPGMNIRSDHQPQDAQDARITVPLLLITAPM